MPGTSKFVRRLRKFTLAVLLLLVGLAAAGALYQRIGQALDRRAVAAPGRLLAAQGITMHLHCTGEGGPTVILEAGAFGFAQVWAWVQPRLAEHTRVCSYDRAGLGWSDEAEAHDGLAGLPEGDYRAACMFTSTASHLLTSHAEFAAWDATMAAARANTSLGERPLIVVSATEPMTGMTDEVLTLNRQMHAELAGLSTRGRHVTIAGANHMSLITESAHAEQVANLLREMIAAAREPLGPAQR